jgi:hypothetical protein
LHQQHGVGQKIFALLSEPVFVSRRALRVQAALGNLMLDEIVQAVGQYVRCDLEARLHLIEASQAKERR